MSRPNRKELSKTEYLEASFRLLAWFGAATRYGKDLNFNDPVAYFKVREVADRYSLDLSDSFQIMSVKEGCFSALINESQTVLATADEALARAARAEGLRAW